MSADSLAAADRGGLSFRTEAAPTVKGGGPPGLAAAAAGLVFVGMLPFGSAGRSPALLLALYWIVLFGWAALMQGSAPMWSRAAPLRGPALLFGGVLLLGLLQLTPWLPAAPQSPWPAVPGAWPAATLDRGATLVELVKLVGLGAAFLAGVAVGADSGRVRTLFRGLAIGSLALGVFALFEFSREPGYYFGVVHSSGPARLTAPFYVADSTAAALGVLCLLNAAGLYAAVARDQKRGARITSWKLRPRLDSLLPLFALLICAFDLYQTASRAGLAATFVAALVMAGTATFRAARSKVGPSAVIMLVVCAIVVVGSLVVAAQPAFVSARQDESTGLLFHRVARIGQDAVERLTIYQTHLAAAVAAPWFGYGLGSWARVNDLYLSADNYELLWRIRSAHNLYLQWFEEAGGVGATLMFGAVAWALVVVGRSVFTARRRRLTQDAVLACAVLLLVHGAVDYSLQQPAISSLFALVLGVAYAISGRNA